jgi:hypothetical protein
MGDNASHLFLFALEQSLFIEILEHYEGIEASEFDHLENGHGLPGHLQLVYYSGDPSEDLIIFIYIHVLLARRDFLYLKSRFSK